MNYIQLTIAETNTKVSVATHAIVAVQEPVFPHAPYTTVLLLSEDALRVLEPCDYIVERLPSDRPV